MTPALGTSVVLHGIAVVYLVYVASVPPVRTEPEKRMAVEIVDQSLASQLVQGKASASSTAAPRQQTHKQVRSPRRVNRSSEAVATPEPTPMVANSELLPTSPSPSEEAMISATAVVPVTNARTTNVGGILPRPAAQASLSQTTTVANAEIESRLRAATSGCYPYAAIRANLEGVTKLGFCVGESGMAGRVQIVQSSGAPLLDRAALDCILPAAMPFPPAKHLCVTVPIRFQLRP
jgi:protein TonB